MTILLQVRSNGQITLPTAVRRQTNLQEGDLLELVVEPDGAIRLVPKVLVERAQAYFWTQRWQQGEREAEADIQAGRLRRFAEVPGSCTGDDVNDALDFLDRPEV